MKKLLLITLTLASYFVCAQTKLTKFYNPESIQRSGFSYQITINVALVKSEKYGDRIEDTYSAELVQLKPTNNSYYSAKTKKSYSCDQLGNLCNPNLIYSLTMNIRYNCDGMESGATGYFKNLNAKKTFSLESRFINCRTPNFYDIIDSYIITCDPVCEGQISKRIDEIEAIQNKDIKNTQNTSTTNSNISNSSNPIAKENKQTSTGMPVNNSGNDPLANYNSSSTTKNSFEKGYETGQQISDAITPLGNALVDAWNRKVDRENAKLATAREIDDKREADSKTFQNNLNTKLNEPNYFNQNVIQKIPLLLSTNSPSWETLLNSNELSKAFGKNTEFIILNFKPISGSKSYNRESIEKSKGEWYTYLQTFGGFTSTVEYKYTYNLNGINYPWKWGYQGTGIQHISKFIYNDKNIVIGVFLKWLTHYSVYDPSFDFETYYKDLFNKVGANYLLLNANTILLKDKLIIIKYGGIEMYDLNLLSNQYLVGWNDYRNSPSFKKLNIGFKKMSEISVPEYGGKKIFYDVYNTNDKGVIIGNVMPKGLAATAGLKDDDIICYINGIPVTSPYILQLIMQIPTINNKLQITYLRNGIEYKTTINL